MKKQRWISTCFFLLFSFYTKTTTTTSKHVSKIEECTNVNVDRLGCRVDFTSLLHDTFSCPFGVKRLQCVFDSDTQDDFKNDFEELVDNLNQLENCCWSVLSFENAYNIVFQSFSLSRFSSASESMLISFKNVYKIDSYAFDMMVNFNDFDYLIRNVYIQLDSLGDFGSLQENSLQLKDDSFRNLYCRQLKFMNFASVQSQQYLQLSSEMFLNSVISHLVIKNSNFTGFVDFDDGKSRNTFVIGNITTLLIDSCFSMTRVNRYSMGYFKNLQNLYIVNSSVQAIEANAFANYETLQKLDLNEGILQLILDNNLLTKLGKDSLKYLPKLEYLSLENNPLQFIDRESFSAFKTSLKKLSMKSTRVSEFDKFYPTMKSLEELILSNNRFLSVADLKLIMSQTKSLKYLDLANLNIFATTSALNLFDVFEDLIQNRPNQTLRYVDIQTVNNAEEIDEKEFFKRLVKFGGSMTYLKSLLSSTFIRVNQNHPCNCAILYLYRNFQSYEIPVESKHSIEANADGFLHEYVNSTSARWTSTFTMLPKCYRNLIYTTSGSIFSEFEQRCITNVSSTLMTTTIESTTATPDATTTKNTVDNDKKSGGNATTISLHYALPFMLALFVIMILAVTIIAVKQRRNHRNRFIKSYEENMAPIEQQKQRERQATLRNTLSIVNSNYAYNDELVNSTLWNTFKLHQNKKKPKAWRLRFKKPV